MKYTKPSNIHLIGISGSGMKPLAEIALAQGYRVSGSDMLPASSLVSLGAQIRTGQQAENIPKDCDLVVYSSAIPATNPELIAAHSRSIPTIHRSEFLNILCRGKKLIAVAGTHGKTSTTALIAHLLDYCGFSPTAFIGGEIIGKERSSYYGDGEYFVAEVDESDGTILNFHPFVGIINNIDLDHLNYYRDLQHIKDTFLQFCRQADPDGGLVFGWDNPDSQEVGLQFTNENRLAFGCQIGCDVRGLSFVATNSNSQFTAMVEREKVSGTVPCFGKHNFQNILCALAVASILDIDIKQACAALQSFSGVKRRLNCHYSSNTLKIFDDYAHNPGKIQAVISALRTAFPDWYLLIVFQPHRYTRMTTMYQEFVASFADANRVLVTKIFSAGEAHDASYDEQQFCQDLRKCSQTSCQLITGDLSANAILEGCARSTPTVILTVGAGDIHHLSYQLRNLVHEEKRRE